MGFFRITNTSGWDAFKARFNENIAGLGQAVEEAAIKAAGEAVAALKEAAPVSPGNNDKPPPGDAEGPLSESFYYSIESAGSETNLQIKTTQPLKLKWVRKGTGIYGPRGRRIEPLHPKQALYWEGAGHPWAYARGQKPNDFVKPVMQEKKKDFSIAILDAMDNQLRK